MHGRQSCTSGWRGSLPVANVPDHTHEKTHLQSLYSNLVTLVIWYWLWTGFHHTFAQAA